MNEKLIENMKMLFNNADIESMQEVKKICEEFDKKIELVKDNNLNIENNPELIRKGILTLDKLYYFVNGIPYDYKKNA